MSGSFGVSCITCDRELGADVDPSDDDALRYCAKHLPEPTECLSDDCGRQCTQVVDGDHFCGPCAEQARDARNIETRAGYRNWLAGGAAS